MLSFLIILIEMDFWDFVKKATKFIAVGAAIAVGIGIGVAAVKASLVIVPVLKTAGASLAVMEGGNTVVGAVVTAALAYTAVRAMEKGYEMIARED
jgi:hypothetical protein